MERLLPLVAAPLFFACVDEPVPIPPPGATEPVERLSELGIFRGDLRDQVPTTDFLLYDVNVELWSDGAKKRRFLHVPEGKSIRADSDRWELPEGTYLVKTFSIPRDLRDPSRGEQLIETRFLVRRGDGFVASTYLWNESQTDAVVSGGNVDVPIRWTDASGIERTGTFHVPGTSQCTTCHDDRALGLRTRQMDRASPGADSNENQIDRLLSMGWLAERPDPRSPLPDPFGDSPLGERARSYLDGNCGHCHAPNREAAQTEVYWDWGHTQSDLPICVPSLSVDDAEHVIVPGEPARSTLITRMLVDEPFLRMPLGPNHLPDERGIALLSDWIEAMPRQECP